MLHARLQRAEAAPAARKFLLFSTSIVNKPEEGSLNVVVGFLAGSFAAGSVAAAGSAVGAVCVDAKESI